MKRIVCFTILIEDSPQALPLGAACIASSIKNNTIKKNKFLVELKTANLEDKNLTAQKIVETLFNKIPDYVFFSVYVWNRILCEEVAAILKSKNKNCICIAGGPEITAEPSSFKNFDFTISGEGEISCVQLLNVLETNSLELPQGVFSANKKYSSKNLRSELPDLKNLSSPYLDGTLDPDIYGGALLELARGCPFKCSYCFESKGENTVRNFPLERIEKELELFSKKNVNQIFVLDPTYNANKKRALQILKLIQKKAEGIFFYFEARTEFMNIELANEFSKIPCALQFGLQSSNPEILKYVNRTFDKKLFCKNIGMLNKTGVIFGFDLIYGLPKDTLEGFKQSINFALELFPNNLETFKLSVLPGTMLFENAESLKINFEHSAPYHIIDSETFSKDDLLKAKKLSAACNIFYNFGMAVPWFMNVSKTLNLKPVKIIEEFSKYIDPLNLNDDCNMPHEKIETFQLEFLKELFIRQHKDDFFCAAENIIKFTGAINRLHRTGKEQIVFLNYRPEDLISPYSTNIIYFSKNKNRHNCKIKLFLRATGFDWKNIK